MTDRSDSVGPLSLVRDRLMTQLIFELDCSTAI